MTALDQWLTWKVHNQGRSGATAVKYRGYVVRLLTWLTEQGLRDPALATTAMLEAFVGLHAHKSGLAPRSRRALVAAVKGFYAWLAKERLLPGADPAVSLDYPQAGIPLPTPATLRTAEALLMAPDLETFVGVRDAAMLALLIGAGLRVSGLCGLNESSLQWTQDTDGRERLLIRPLEKGGKQRLVPVTTEARLLLRAYLGHPDLAAIPRVLPSGDRVLFVSLRNRAIPAHEYYGERRRISPRSVQDRIKYYGELKRLPADQLHPHALRHLFGTELAEDDQSLDRIQALLGHADIKATQIYTHLSMRKLAAIQDRSNPLRKIRTPVSELARRLEQVKP